MKVAVPLNENIHKDDSSLSDGLSHLHQAVTTIWIFFFFFLKATLPVLNKISVHPYHLFILGVEQLDIEVCWLNSSFLWFRSTQKLQSNLVSFSHCMRHLIGRIFDCLLASLLSSCMNHF